MRKITYSPVPGAMALPPPRLGLFAQILNGIAVYLRSAAAATAERRRARESMYHLMAMGDRELRDIGISRSQILSAVYGPVGPERGTPWRQR
jgi:uncharacterized protein YjiS (DUF1127 family)